MTGFVVLIAAAYLFGAVPFGFIIAKAKGKNLRSIGSGNIGATNVTRALGRNWGYLCFAIDVLKGLLPMAAAGAMVDRPPTVSQLWLWLAAGCAAVLGHIFPVYLGFKGGKGVATSLGVVLGLYPYYTMSGIAAFIVWAVLVILWRYVSLASMAASAAFPAAFIAAIIAKNSWQMRNLWPLLIAAFIMPAVVIIRHKENIKRLLNGSESKIRQK